MKNVIIGTAGHVDHGKTCLIKALTGIDTDRLKEEKQRGITIELGFASLPNDLDLDIGIIDVPGHEKFVRHMLAGIGGIDIVLLIIAADEGIMPQTAEHFEILKMLRIPRGIVALTKTDLVDADWLELVREDVEAYVRGTFLEGAPIVPISSQTGENIEELRTLILSMAAECGDRREKKELLRLPADRVFTVDGFGTVITGTLMEGSVEKGDEVMIYPAGKKARVRNVQIHGHDVGRAAAGSRTAINLTGIKKEELERGDVIAYPGSLEAAQILDVRIDLFQDTKRLLKSGSRLHFYYGAAETLCKAVLLSGETLGGGQSGYGQLRFESEVAVKRGDRFILRFYSPMETIGGGIVLNASPRKRKRFDETAAERLRIEDTGSCEQVLELLFLEEGSRLADAKKVVQKLGKTWEEAQPLLEALLEEGAIFDISGSFLRRDAAASEELFLHRDIAAWMEQKAQEILDGFHLENPVNPGMPKEAFRNRLKAAISGDDMKKIECFIDFLLEKGVIRETGGMIAAAGFSVRYTQEQQRLADLMEALYRKAGFEPPELDAVPSLIQDKTGKPPKRTGTFKQDGKLMQRDGGAAGGNPLQKDSRLIQQMADSLCASGKLKRINYQYYMHRDAFAQAMDLLMAALRERGSITLADYRDLLGTSRKYAMLILEYADEDKITKMDGDRRIPAK